MNNIKSPSKGRRWALVGLTGLLVGAAGLWGKLHPGVVNDAAPPEPQSTTPAQPVKPPVDLLALAERANSSSLALTPEQIREEKSIHDGQVKKAGEWLENPDIEKRLAGAEQLAAYPTPKAEGLLVKALETDREAEVRRAAAISLGMFKKPKEETIQALLAALEDPTEEVPSAALQTLGMYFFHETEGSARSKQIVEGLAALSNSKHTPQDIGDDIRDLLGGRIPN
jgi:hypothetical protein